MGRGNPGTKAALEGQDNSGQTGEGGQRDDGQTLPLKGHLILRRISSEEQFGLKSGDKVDPNWFSSGISMR